MSDEQGRRMRRVGAIWKPREGARSKGSGNVSINGLRQQFVILPNDRKRGKRDPDYVLMSADEPEVDPFTRKQQQSRPAAPDQRPETASAAERPAADYLPDEDVPF